MKCVCLRACMKKWKKMSKIISGASCDYCRKCSFRTMLDEVNSIPNDVPKGHLVVYVGEDLKRFVIKIKLLNHPLFKALLDQAQDVYDFTADSKLCIPCDEKMFLDVVRCASSPLDRRLSQCL